jgi:hypothetical protein
VQETSVKAGGTFHAGFLLNLFFSTLKMEAVRSFEMSVDTHHPRRWHFSILSTDNFEIPHQEKLSIIKRHFIR